MKSPSSEPGSPVIQNVNALPCPFCWKDARIKWEESDPHACCTDWDCAGYSIWIPIRRWNKRRPSQQAPVMADAEAIAFLWTASDGERMVTFDRPLTRYEPLYRRHSPAPGMVPELEKLVTKWREEKDQKHHGHVDYWHGVHDALYDCAVELEAALKASRGEK